MEETQASKIVYLRRLPLTSVEKHSNTEEAKEYFGSGYRAISSFFVHNSIRPGTGLTIAEEDILMPIVLGISIEDREYRSKVVDYFHSISTRVEPHMDEDSEVGGTPLEISLQNPSKPLDRTNLPVNIEDYIKWRHARVHPEVARNRQAGEGNPLKRYYIYDPIEFGKLNQQADDLKDRAIQAFSQIKDDVKRVRQYLSLLTVNPDAYKGKERTHLRKIADTDPEAFLKVHNDPNKDLEFLLNLAIQKNIFERIGNKLIWKESQAFFSSNIKDGVAILKDPKNSETLLQIKHHLKPDTKKK